MDVHCYRSFIGILSAAVTVLLGTIVYQQTLVPSLHHDHAQVTGPPWRVPPSFPGFSAHHIPDSADYSNLFSWAAIFNKTTYTPPVALPTLTIPSIIITVTETVTMTETAYVNPEPELVQQWVEHHVHRLSWITKFQATRLFQKTYFLGMIFGYFVNELVLLSGYVAFHCLYFEGFLWENWQYVLEQWAAFLPSQWSSDDTPYWLCLWRTLYVVTFLACYSPVLVYKLLEDPEIFKDVFTDLSSRLRDPKTSKSPGHQSDVVQKPIDAVIAKPLARTTGITRNKSHKRPFDSFTDLATDDLPVAFKRSKNSDEKYADDASSSSRPIGLIETTPSDDLHQSSEEVAGNETSENISDVLPDPSYEHNGDQSLPTLVSESHTVAASDAPDDSDRMSEDKLEVVEVDDSTDGNSDGAVEDSLGDVNVDAASIVLEAEEATVSETTDDNVDDNSRTGDEEVPVSETDSEASTEILEDGLPAIFSQYQLQATAWLPQDSLDSVIDQETEFTQGLLIDHPLPKSVWTAAVTYEQVGVSSDHSDSTDYNTDVAHWPPFTAPAYSCSWEPKTLHESGMTVPVCLWSRNTPGPWESRRIESALPRSQGGNSSLDQGREERRGKSQPRSRLILRRTSAFITESDTPLSSPTPIVRLPPISTDIRSEPFSTPPESLSDPGQLDVQSVRLFYVGRLDKEDIPERKHRGGVQLREKKAAAAQRYAELVENRRLEKEAKGKRAKEGRKAARSDSSVKSPSTTPSAPATQPPDVPAWKAITDQYISGSLPSQSKDKKPTPAPAEKSGEGVTSASTPLASTEWFKNLQKAKGETKVSYGPT